MAQSFQLYLLASLAAFSGLLFGYDIGVMSGALLFIREEFDMDEVFAESSVAITNLGSLIFALVAGYLSDKVGRKPTVMLGALIFIAGTAMLAACQEKWLFLFGRLVVGMSVGLGSMIAPLYIAECSPESIRGALVTMNQLMITVGILWSNLMDGAFAKVDQGWRWAFVIGAAPAVVMFFGMFFIPESPRYLIQKNQTDRARDVLKRIRNKDDPIEEELEQIIKVVNEENKTRESVKGFVIVEILKTPAVRRALALGCMLQLIQQASGINTVIYFAGTIMQMAGISSDASEVIWYTCIAYAVNVVMTFPGMFLIERLGRRILTIGSLFFISISLIILGVGFQLTRSNAPDVTFNEFQFNSTDVFVQIPDQNHCTKYTGCTPCTNTQYTADQLDCGFCFSSSGDVDGSCVAVNPNDTSLAAYGRCSSSSSDFTFVGTYCLSDYSPIIIIGLVLFLSSFSSGIACTAWAVNSEIYPLWARSTGVSLATATNWATNLVVTMSFLSMLNPLQGFGPHGTFFFYAAVSAVGCLLVILLQPETKGKSIEQMEEVFSVPLWSKQPKSA